MAFPGYTTRINPPNIFEVQEKVLWRVWQFTSTTPITVLPSRPKTLVSRTFQVWKGGFKKNAETAFFSRLSGQDFSMEHSI